MDIETLSTLLADSEHADIWKAVAGACQEGVAIRPVTAEVNRSLGETDAVVLNLSMQQGRFNHPGVSWSENDDEVTFEFTEEAIRHYLIGAGRIYPLSWSARSKFGGLPDVPEGFDWPVGSDDYFEFIAQFDLSELPDFRRRSDLPAVGMLSFFLDMSGDHYESDHLPVVCRYFPDVSALETVGRHPRKDGWERRDVWCRDAADCLDQKTKAVSGVSLAMMPMLYLPDRDHVFSVSGDEEGCRWKELRAFGGDRYTQVSTHIDEVAHSLGVRNEWTDTRLLGEPRFAQDTSFKDNERLLLQFAGWGPYSFGDAGNVYVAIDREDLVAGRFDQVRATWDCY
ncbi:MAG: YwqG family protein [Planctomycetota bacterium]